MDGMEIIFSPSLLELNEVTHAFTTRVGGSTKAPYDSFNLGRSVGDDAVKRDAIENRKKLCNTLSIDFHKLVVPGQVHSPNVALIEDLASLPDLKGVDGVTTAREQIPLLLHFADCVPVIVADPQAKAVGVFHAGWRGTAQNIVGNGVKVMARELGAKPERMRAAIGPAIGACCYPTGEDVVEALIATVADKGIAQSLIHRLADRAAPDLKAFNALQLLEAGVELVDTCDFCTACKPELFYSHRQSGGTTGRQGALVALV